MRRNPVILHVSDLHFGRSVNPLRPGRGERDSARKALETAVRVTRPDFIVVTGDLSNGGRVEELVEVRQYLTSLLDKLWADGQATRCIVIPGNHDVWRTTVASPSAYLGRRNRLAEFDEAFPEYSFLSASVPSTNSVHLIPRTLVDYYQEHGGIAGGSISLAEAVSKDRDALRLWEFFPAFQLAFLKLNSNVKLSRWKPGHIARGYVGLAQRQAAWEFMQDYQRATQKDAVTFADARRVALVHHHVTRLPNVKLEDWMLMDDAGEVARWLARLNIRLVLHGHYHRADLVGLTYWNTEANNSKVETIVVSAGSATAKGADDGHNSCHHIELEHFRTRIRRPLLDNGEFQPLDAAASFEFLHKADLTFDDGTTKDFPILTDALQLSMEGGERYADRTHTYSNIDSEAFIDKDRNYVGNVLLEGKNESGGATIYIPLTFTAVGAQYFEDCKCRAIDVSAGTDLLIEPMERRPLQLFACRIYFQSPLPPDQEFRIEVRFQLDKVMLDENDYDMLSLMRFSRGVARARFCMLSEKQMIGPTLMEVRGGKLVPSPVAPQPANRIPRNGRAPGGVKGFEAILQSPTALSYLMLYRKLV